MIQRTSHTFEGAIAVSTGHVYVGLSAFMGLMSGGEWKPLQHPHPLSVTEVAGGIGVTIGDFGTAVSIITSQEYADLRRALGWPDEDTTQGSTNSRLRRLQELLDDGLLNQEEYDAKRAELIREL